MIEKEVLDYLTDKLNCNVYLEEPDNEERTYIVISKSSDYIIDHLNFATIDFYIYSDTLYNTSLFSEEVKRVMMNIIELNNISNVELNSLYNFTDTEKKKYRYFADFDIVYLE